MIVDWAIGRDPEIGGRYIVYVTVDGSTLRYPDVRTWLGPPQRWVDTDPNERIEKWLDGLRL